MTVGIRLIRVKDGIVLCRENFIYEQGTRLLPFSGWRANNARAFKEELDRAFLHLSIEIVRALSNIQDPPDLEP
jgi:hypothetical protein